MYVLSMKDVTFKWENKICTAYACIDLKSEVKRELLKKIKQYESQGKFSCGAYGYVDYLEYCIDEGDDGVWFSATAKYNPEDGRPYSEEEGKQLAFQRLVEKIDQAWLDEEIDMFEDADRFCSMADEIINRDSAISSRERVRRLSEVVHMLEK